MSEDDDAFCYRVVFLIDSLGISNLIGRCYWLFKLSIFMAVMKNLVDNPAILGRF